MITPLLPSSLLEPLFASAAMRAVLSDGRRLQRMLDIEHALARAEVSLGVIPQDAAAAIGQACKADLYDIPSLAEAAPAVGNVLIPLVKALTAEVKKRDAAASGFVHWGATSQDIIDTALVLELRDGLALLCADLDRAAQAFAAQADKHRNTPAAARTWLQQALPMPFGLKLAGYAAALARSRARLERLAREALVLQFGGAAGTLAALGDKGFAIAEKLASELSLPLPDAPWHSHGDRLAEVASAVAILAGTCGKIARDVSLLMQTEVGEAFEPAAQGRGGSSSMPHKRNPVGSAAAIACATLAPQLAASILAAQMQDHERGTGTWPAEWPAFPALLLVTSGALAAIAEIAEGLEADPAKMRANLDITHGLVMSEAVSMALAKKIGKSGAHTLLEEASSAAHRGNRHLKDVLADDKRVTAHLSRAEIEALFDPMNYQGAAQAFIDRLLASARMPPGRKA